MTKMKTKTKTRTKEPEDSHPGGVSRRSFTRGVALAGTAVVLLPAHLLAQAQPPASTEEESLLCRYPVRSPVSRMTPLRFSSTSPGPAMVQISAPHC